MVFRAHAIERVVTESGAKCRAKDFTRIIAPTVSRRPFAQPYAPDMGDAGP